MTRNFGVWREGEHGRAKVFDPILLKDTRAPEDAPLVVQRSYWPVHPVGHLRFIECTDLDEHGQPAGDLDSLGQPLLPLRSVACDRRGLEPNPGEPREMVVEAVKSSRRTPIAPMAA
ncbi:MAG: hypothetical protein QM784_38335 [Polyangiaceae bacterium]